MLLQMLLSGVLWFFFAVVLAVVITLVEGLFKTVFRRNPLRIRFDLPPLTPEEALKEECVKDKHFFISATMLVYCHHCGRMLLTAV